MQTANGQWLEVDDRSRLACAVPTLQNLRPPYDQPGILAIKIHVGESSGKGLGYRSNQVEDCRAGLAERSRAQPVAVKGRASTAARPTQGSLIFVNLSVLPVRFQA